jgi:hypothetical protein
VLEGQEHRYSFDERAILNFNCLRNEHRKIIFLVGNGHGKLRNSNPLLPERGSMVFSSLYDVASVGLRCGDDNEGDDDEERWSFLDCLHG